jgi:hypothetical protein
MAARIEGGLLIRGAEAIGCDAEFLSLTGLFSEITKAGLGLRTRIFMKCGCDFSHATACDLVSK